MPEGDVGRPGFLKVAAVAGGAILVGKYVVHKFGTPEAAISIANGEIEAKFSSTIKSGIVKLTVPTLADYGKNSPTFTGTGQVFLKLGAH